MNKATELSSLLFHGLVELVSIASAFAIFILAWNSSAYLTNNYLRLLGIGYAFIAIIDLLHTFSFQGMAVFIGYDDNLAPQLWLAARYLQAATLLAAPLLLDRKMNNHLVFAGYAVAVAVLLTLVFSGHFPDCLITGKGLTRFKVYSEYVISAVLLVALVLLYWKRHFFDRAIFIMVTGLKQPFEWIFRDLKQAEEALRRIDIAAIHRTVEAIRAHNPFLADGLAAKPQELQFGRLLQLVRAAGEKIGLEATA